MGDDSKQYKCLICGTILEETPDEWTSVNCPQCNAAFRLNSKGTLTEVEENSVQIKSDTESFLGSSNFESFDVENLLAEEEARKQRELEEEKEREEQEAAKAEAKKKKAEADRARAKAEKKRKSPEELPQIELPGLNLEPVKHDLEEVAGELEALSFDELSDPQKRAFGLEDSIAGEGGSDLAIEGLDREKSTEREFGIKCPVCDTRVYAKISQVGKRIECPDCYTKIEVPQAPKLKEEWAKFAAKLNDQNPDEELKLSEPVELTPADMDGLGLDPVVEDLLSSATPSLQEPNATGPGEVAEASPGAESEQELTKDETGRETDPGVEPVSVEPLDIEPVALEPAPPPADGTEPVPPPVANGSPRQTDSPWATKSVQREEEHSTPDSRPKKKKSRRKILESEGVDSGDELFAGADEELDMSPFTAESLYSRSVTAVLTGGVLIRGAIAVVLLTVSAMFFVWGEGFRAMPERGVSGWTSMLGNYIAFLVTWIAGTIGVLRVASMLFRESAIGNKKVTRWSITGFEDAKSTFLLFAFSYIVACSPFWGLWVITRIPFGSGVAFLIAPLLLLGAWYNRSPFVILALDAFEDIKTTFSDWQWFFTYMLLLAVLNIFGGLFYWIGFWPLFVVAALIQTGTVFVFAALTGWHVGRVVKRLEDGA